MAANTPSGVQPRPWQAVVQAKLVRGVGVDQVEEVDYDGQGHFTRRRRVAGGPGPGVVTVLDGAHLKALLAELRTELEAPPPGVDTVGLEVFADLIGDALRAMPLSHRFDGARFGAVIKDEVRCVLYGHLVMGVDVIGTVRDESHRLSFEQQLVTGPAGAYTPLAAADSASLARALAANPPTDPLWQEIRDDALAALVTV